MRFRLINYEGEHVREFIDAQEAIAYMRLLNYKTNDLRELKVKKENYINTGLDERFSLEMNISLFNLKRKWKILLTVAVQMLHSLQRLRRPHSLRRSCR